MRTIPREVSQYGNWDNPVETTRRLLRKATKSEMRMYILGALHDATYNPKHQTYRFSQSSENWLKLVQQMLAKLGHKSWTYREGRDRFVWALETSAKIDREEKPKTESEKIAYIRGYFDTEGGMPRSNNHFPYFQFSQRDRSDLKQVKIYLEELGINCGIIHNPSQKVDKNYWRFFINRKSHFDFMNTIYSFHPRKMRQIDLRMKI